MKVVLLSCVLLVLLGLTQFTGVAAEEEPTENPITDEQAQCILDVLTNTDVDTEHVGDMALDIAQTFQRLIQHFLRCEEILSDPPTSLEERRHEACRLTWYATVLAELLRLRNQSQALDFFDELIYRVETCRAL